MADTSTTNANALSRMESYQYPSAHLGHLSEGQQIALDRFKALSEEQGYYKSAQATGTGVASHDDETLLRYLRARKFSPPEAFKQFKDTEEWRKANHLDELYSTIDVNEYEETRRLYPQWTGRRDRRGIPIYVFEVAHLTSKTVAAYEHSVAKKPTVKHTSNVPTKMLRLFALYENLTRFVLPLCSAMSDRPHPETPISQSNNIVDISKVGMKQFWNLKSHMQDASTLATAYYPETLDRIFIIGAPSFFPTVWGWIKRWFDPITVSKIFILSSSTMKPTLEQYIDPANIPKKYGGQLDFEFGKMPILEPAIEKSLHWEHTTKQDGKTTIPTGPIKWRQGTDNVMEAAAVGTENGKPRDTIIARVRTSWQELHGISRMNTAVDWSKELQVTTPGISTHPVEGEFFAGIDSLERSDSSPPQSILPDRTATGTATDPMSVPAMNTATTGADLETHRAEVSHERGSTYNPTTAETNEHGDRTGTSSTRYEQQDRTHAAGQMGGGTPHVVDHGHGDKTATMEPSTVGQAPKEVSVPKPETEGAPSYLDQAKAAAGQAYGGVIGAGQSVLGVVGYGTGSTGEAKKEPEVAKKHDPRVDQADNKLVEEFMRSQVSSGRK